jgi:hypothetical protein
MILYYTRVTKIVGFDLIKSTISCCYFLFLSIVMYPDYESKASLHLLKAHLCCFPNHFISIIHFTRSKLGQMKRLSHLVRVYGLGLWFRFDQTKWWSTSGSCL